MLRTSQGRENTFKVLRVFIATVSLHIVYFSLHGLLSSFFKLSIEKHLRINGPLCSKLCCSRVSAFLSSSKSSNTKWESWGPPNS